MRTLASRREGMPLMWKCPKTPGCSGFFSAFSNLSSLYISWREWGCKIPLCDMLTPAHSTSTYVSTQMPTTVGYSVVVIDRRKCVWYPADRTASFKLGCGIIRILRMVFCRNTYLCWAISFLNALILKVYLSQEVTSQSLTARWQAGQFMTSLHCSLFSWCFSSVPPQTCLFLILKTSAHLATLIIRVVKAPVCCAVVGGIQDV